MSKRLTSTALKITAGASVLVLAGTLAACSADTSEPGGTNNNGSDNNSSVDTGTPSNISIAMRNDVDSFDPFKSAGEAGAKQVFDAVYDTLVRVTSDATSVDISGSMATEWEIREDGGLFTLHEGLTCQDGTAIDAEGVAASITHLAAPETGALYASRVFGPGGLAGVTADNDANTIDISLNEPYTYLLEGLTQAYIVCPTAFDSIEALAQEPAGTGAYALTELNRGESYMFERRDTPVVDAATLPETLEMRVINDDTTRANLLETQGIDITSVLGRDAERLQTSFEQIDGLAYLSDALLFNQTEGLAVNELEVRKAISLAIDNASYARAATFDLGQPIDTMYTPNMLCYTEENASLVTGYDADAAKATLEAAGYGEGGTPITIRLIGIATQNSGPELIADSLRNIGIDVELTKGTLEQAIGIVFGTGEWDAIVFPYPVPAPIPSALVNQVSGTFGETLNVGNIQNDDYNRFSNEAAQTLGDNQCALWGQAEAALLENVDIKPVVWSNAAWFANDGFAFNADFYKVDTRSITAN